MHPIAKSNTGDSPCTLAPSHTRMHSIVFEAQCFQVPADLGVDLSTGLCIWWAPAHVEPVTTTNTDVYLFAGAIYHHVSSRDENSFLPSEIVEIPFYNPSLKLMPSQHSSHLSKAALFAPVLTRINRLIVQQPALHLSAGVAQENFLRLLTGNPGTHSPPSGNHPCSTKRR